MASLGLTHAVRPQVIGAHQQDEPVIQRNGTTGDHREWRGTNGLPVVGFGNIAVSIPVVRYAVVRDTEAVLPANLQEVGSHGGFCLGASEGVELSCHGGGHHKRAHTTGIRSHRFPLGIGNVKAETVVEEGGGITLFHRLSGGMSGEKKEPFPGHETHGGEPPSTAFVLGQRSEFLVGPLASAIACEPIDCPARPASSHNVEGFSITRTLGVLGAYWRRGNLVIRPCGNVVGVGQVAACGHPQATHQEDIIINASRHATFPADWRVGAYLPADANGGRVENAFKLAAEGRACVGIVEQTGRIEARRIVTPFGGCVRGAGGSEDHSHKPTYQKQRQQGPLHRLSPLHGYTIASTISHGDGLATRTAGRDDRPGPLSHLLLRHASRSPA